MLAAASAFQSEVQASALPANITAESVPAVQAACERSVATLQQLLKQQAQQQEALQGAGEQQGSAAEQAAEKTRSVQAALDTLRDRLDSACTTLYDVLEDVREAWPDQPNACPDPKEVVAMGYRLRYTTFRKSGMTSQSYAPQPYQMAQSTLMRLGHQWQAQQQQQQQQMMIPPAPPPQQAPRAPTGPEISPAGSVMQGYREGFTLHDGTPLPQVVDQPPPQVVDQPRPAPPPRAIGGIDLGLILNPDMEEVSSYSETDDESDDF